jgi:chromosome segregation ATPase
MNKTMNNDSKNHLADALDNAFAKKDAEIERLRVQLVWVEGQYSQCKGFMEEYRNERDALREKLASTEWYLKDKMNHAAKDSAELSKKLELSERLVDEYRLRNKELLAATCSSCNNTLEQSLKPETSDYLAERQALKPKQPTIVDYFALPKFPNGFHKFTIYSDGTIKATLEKIGE